MSSVSKVSRAWKAEEAMHPFFFKVMPPSLVFDVFKVHVCMHSACAYR